MDGVLLGFGVVAVLIIVGTATAALSQDVAARIQHGVTPLVYYITNPCLMVVLVSQTDVRLVAGLYAPLALAIALLTALCFLLFGLLVRRSIAETAVGAMASSYVNAGNIGVPIALYVVGNTAPVVSVLLAQLLVLAPVYLTIFGFIARRRAAGGDARAGSGGAAVLRSLFNPVTTGVLIGGTISWFQWQLPEVVWEPIRMTGEASIPLLLIIFGIALYQERPFKVRSRIPDSIVGTLCKSMVMPLVAWVLAGPVVGLGGSDLLGVVAMAALPTAQNVYLFGLQYGMPTTVAKDVIFISSFLSVPVMLLAAWLLAA